MNKKTLIVVISLLFFSIAVFAGNNPIITSTPITTATEGVLYTYDVNAIDADNDTLTYSLLINPAGMSINSLTGLISWTPTFSQSGLHNVTVQVSDGNGGTATQSWFLIVNNVNAPPAFTSTPITNATQDIIYTYTATATDPDGDNLTLTATTLPSWLSFNTTTYVLSGTPTNADVGNHNVVLSVTDNITASNQSFIIIVNNVNDAPIWITNISDTIQNEDFGTIILVNNLSLYITDGDGDVITFAVQSENVSQVDCSITGTQLTLLSV